jgi:hypothetical protein
MALWLGDIGGVKAGSGRRRGCGEEKAAAFLPRGPSGDDGAGVAIGLAASEDLEGNAVADEVEPARLARDGIRATEASRAGAAMAR